MLDYEGSRSEFLKFLAEFGEEPAFIARARAPQIALESLLQGCEAKRDEMLKWPKHHLSALANHIGGQWSRLGCLLADPESAKLLETLHANMPTSKAMRASGFGVIERHYVASCNPPSASIVIGGHISTAWTWSASTSLAATTMSFT